MDPARFARLKEIFLAVRDLPRAERDAYLDQACAADPLLRMQIQSMIEQDSESLDILHPRGIGDLIDAESGFPDANAGFPDARRGFADARRGFADARGGFSDAEFSGEGQPPRVPHPDRIGPYKILALLGEGGMGVVYHAEQTHPIRREVALKVVRWGFGSESTMARFESERQALALMDHPNIARVLDAGSDESGNPYFVMELVRGVPITEYARVEALSIRERLELFRSVCRAAHDAHVKGIIHRDLKPSNILVSTHDGVPLPKIIDFGIAKATDVTAPPSWAAPLTQEGRLIGTLDYMSPEQARGMPGGVDTRSDVYSLGVILYELLTGDLPYKVRGLPIQDAVEVIAHQDPDPIHRTATGERRLDADIETIVRKALEKEPSRRYNSAAAFADDIDRFLRSEPIQARPPTTLYQLRKLASRHRIAFGFLATVFAFSILLAIVMSVQFEAQRRERARAEAEARKATRINEFLQQMLASVNPGQKNKDVRVREVLDDAARQVDFGLSDEPEVEAALRRTIGNTYHAIGLHDEAEEQLTRALDIRRRVLGEDDPDVAESLHDLAAFRFWYPDRDNLAKADSLCREALAIRLKAFGENHRDVASSLQQLGQVHAERSELSAAESLYIRSIAIREKTMGPDDPDVTKGLLALASVLTHLNRVAEAESCLRRSVEIFRTRHPGDHPAVAWVIGELSNLMGRSNLRIGDSLAVEALAMERRMWGDRHSRVAEALYRLGAKRVNQGRITEAEPLYREALDILISLHGDQTPAAAQAYNNLGWCLSVKGDLDQAETHYRKAVAIWREKLEEGWIVGMGLNNLAAVLSGQGQDKESFQLQLESLRIFEDLLGPDHRNVGLANNNIAVFLMERGRYREAELRISKAVAIWTKSDGEKSQRTAAAIANLGFILHGMDQLLEAEAQYRNALGIHESVASGDSWNVGRSLATANLGMCLHHQGRLEEAEELLRTAEEKLRGAAGEKHPQYPWMLATLGSLLVDRGSQREAEATLSKSLQMLDPSKPAMLRWIPFTRNALGACVALQGRTAEADSLFELSGHEAWTGIGPPFHAAKRIARDRAIRFYESIGRTDRVAQIRASGS